jgi:hypothetical protein
MENSQQINQISVEEEEIEEPESEINQPNDIEEKEIEEPAPKINQPNDKEIEEPVPEIKINQPNDIEEEEIEKPVSEMNRPNDNDIESIEISNSDINKTIEVEDEIPEWILEAGEKIKKKENNDNDKKNNDNNMISLIENIEKELQTLKQMMKNEQKIEPKNFLTQTGGEKTIRRISTIELSRSGRKR